MTNKFNLVDEHWIPVAGKGLVSLADIFSDSSLSALGGNPVQKIALTKLLLAIAQTAYTPADDEDWKKLGAPGMADKSLAYLREKRDLFWLYGNKPFLQMPAIAKAKKQNFGAIQIFVATGNTTVLTQSQTEVVLTDAEKAILIIQMMGFGLGGRKPITAWFFLPDIKANLMLKENPLRESLDHPLDFSGFCIVFCKEHLCRKPYGLILLQKKTWANLKFSLKGLELRLGKKCPKVKIAKRLNR